MAVEPTFAFVRSFVRSFVRWFAVVAPLLDTDFVVVVRRCCSVVVVVALSLLFEVVCRCEVGEEEEGMCRLDYP